MIRNIVFDLGNVLISFKPAEFLKAKCYPEEFIARALQYVFHSEEWLLLDNGDISLKEAVLSISQKSTLTKQEIEQIFDLRKEMMFPLEQNVKLLPELRKRGFLLFYLSNFPSDIFPDIKNANPFFQYFEGGIISADVNFSKPQKRIYEILLEKFSLVPNESVFIDDIEKNIHAAVQTGMLGIHVPDPENVSSEIERIISTS
jgi:putative hydrolase of the HAD superfamily